MILNYIEANFGVFIDWNEKYKEEQMFGMLQTGNGTYEHKMLQVKMFANCCGKGYNSNFKGTLQRSHTFVLPILNLYK